MAKIIAKFGYLKGKSRGGYAKYIATREGVEKVDESLRDRPVTQSQQVFGIREIFEQLLDEFLLGLGARSISQGLFHVLHALPSGEVFGIDPAGFDFKVS